MCVCSSRQSLSWDFSFDIRTSSDKNVRLAINHFYPQLNVEETLLKSASHYGLEEINIVALDLLSTISHEGAK